MFSRASDRCGSPPKFEPARLVDVKTGLCGFGLGFGFGLVGGGGGGLRGRDCDALELRVELARGVVGPQDQVCRRRARRPGGPPRRRATMIRVRVLGRRGTRKQCASLSRRVLHRSRRSSACLAAALARALPLPPGPRHDRRAGQLRRRIRAAELRARAACRAAALDGRAARHGAVLPGRAGAAARAARRRARRRPGRAGVRAGGRAHGAPHRSRAGPSGAVLPAAVRAGREARLRALRPAPGPPRASSRVAVVLPTNTWQAYNFRDVDGNGVGDTWYADPHYNGVDLTRPVPEPRRAAALTAGTTGASSAGWPARGKRPDFLLRRGPRAAERASSSHATTTSSSFPGTTSTRRRTSWTRCGSYRDLGRQPRLPLGERLLLPSRTAWAPPLPDRPLVRLRPLGREPDRRRLRRLVR